MARLYIISLISFDHICCTKPWSKNTVWTGLVWHIWSYVIKIATPKLRIYRLCQWPFQEPIYCTIYKALSGLCFRKYPTKIWSYMVLTCLHFRILSHSHWYIRYWYSHYNTGYSQYQYIYIYIYIFYELVPLIMSLV